MVCDHLRNMLKFFCFVSLFLRNWLFSLDFLPMTASRAAIIIPSKIYSDFLNCISASQKNSRD